jgi:hypothetical protein
MDALEYKGLDTQSSYYLDKIILSIAHGKPTFVQYNWLAHVLAVYYFPCEVVKAHDKFGFWVTDKNRVSKA